MKSICCIGHITKDHIVTPKLDRYLPGGTAFYFAHGMSHLQHHEHFSLVTAMATEDIQAADDIRSLGIDVTVFPSRHTVFFENIYGINTDNRQQRVKAKADAFTVEELQSIEADIFHLGSLLADDFSIDVLRHLHEKGCLSVDAQGYLREVRGDKVYPIDWTNKREALQLINILKVNEHEMEVLTGLHTAPEAARQLATWGVEEVVVTLGSLGSIIYADGQLYTIPAYPPTQIVDATGCGDTYMAGYLYMRSQGATVREAGCFAAAMSTLKLEGNGPFNRTETDILRLIHS